MNAGQADDAVAERRRRIARLVASAKRVGYSALAASVVIFFAGFVTGFPGWTVTATVTLLAVSFVVLPLPIVLGYGIRAAEREDRARKSP